jgi:hypothetical protein
VIAHQETCINGFPEGDVKAKVAGVMDAGKELTSNVLAIIEKAVTFLSMFGFSVANHRRRMLLAHQNDTAWEGQIEEQPMMNHTRSGATRCCTGRSGP